MPIIDRSYYDAAQKGRTDRQNYETNLLRQQAAQQDIAQTGYVQNLLRNPNTTPEQFARAGRSDIANSLLNMPDQQKQFAEQMANAVRYASQAPAGQTKAFVEKNFPQLVQAYGPNWATDSDEEVHQQLQGIGAKFGVQAGIAPTIPKPEEGFTLSQGQTRFGSDGKPIASVAPAPPKPDAADNYDPQSVENTAQMIAQGQIPMLTGYALRSKWGQEVVSRVKEINDAFNAADFKSQEQALKQFTSGKNGNTVRSLNVAVQHLEQLQELGKALNNGDIPALNKAAIAWKKNTGQSAPTTFEAAKKIVTDEVVKAVIGAGGGVADREEAANTISSANSPEQLNQVIDAYMGLMTGQLNGLRQQYSESTGRKDFERFLLPETRKRLETHGQDQRLTPEQAAKLPAGAKFIGMDGVTRVKR